MSSSHRPQRRPPASAHAEGCPIVTVIHATKLDGNSEYVVHKQWVISEKKSIYDCSRSDRMP